MEVKEVFSKVYQNQLLGVMFHEEQANLFDFLGLPGFKRVHEYRFFDEIMELRTVERYFINHYNQLLKPVEGNGGTISSNWYGYKQFEISNSSKENAIKESFEKWREWESNTKRLYQDCYTELMKINETAAAMKINELVQGVDEELKRADRMYIKLSGMNFDLKEVYLLQDDLHKKYKKKSKKLGFHIC